MVRYRVEIFSTVKAVETLDEGVVEDKHDGGEIPGPSLIPEEHLSDITYISDFWMTKTELPNNQRCIEDQSGDHDSQYQARNETKDRVGIWERHDSQAN